MWRGFFVHSGFLRSGQYQLRAEVWGFPRSDLPAVEAALRQAAGASCDVSAVEPDRLVVAGGWSALDTAVATKPWLAPLLTPACGNLFVVLRMEVRNVAPGAGRRPRSSNALVMAGVAEDRSFVLKACGHSTGSRISERLCHGMAWAHESAFLRSLDEFLRASARS